MESQLTFRLVLGFGIPYIPYKKLLCLFLVCTSLTLSGISTLSEEGFELFGVSAQSDSGIRIWLSLYTLPEVIVPISGVLLSDTFRYFYSWSGGGLTSGVTPHTDSGIRIWHSLYTLPEVIFVPISGVHLSDTFRYFYSWSGGGLNSLESQLILTVVLGFGIPYIPYQKIMCLFLVCTSLTLSGISTLGQEGV